jgi:cysteinyl-tRNA synthetase
LLNIVNNQQASSPQAESKSGTLVNKIINFAGAQPWALIRLFICGVIKYNDISAPAMRNYVSVDFLKRFIAIIAKPTSLFVDVFPINETVNKFSRIQQLIAIKKGNKRNSQNRRFCLNLKYTSHNYQSDPDGEKELVLSPVGPEEYF